MPRLSLIIWLAVAAGLGWVAPGWAQEPAIDNTWIQEHLSLLDALFGDVVHLLATFLFADLGTGVPLIVAVLLFGGIYYSFFFGWISLRGFRHSIDKDGDVVTIH